MLLHELGHVDAHHRLFGIEEEVRQRLAELGLAHPGGPEEQETAIGTIGIRQASPGTAHRIGHCFHRFRLTHYPLVQGLFHAQQLVLLAFQHLGNRNSGPLGYHLGDFLVGHLVAQQLIFGLGVLLFLILGSLNLFLQFRNHPILQL